ncbi:MAG: gluconate 2-dehydrogenase subunit 3 family protein [Myxococcales bacterium]
MRAGEPAGSLPPVTEEPLGPAPVPAPAWTPRFDRRTFFKGSLWAAATTASGALLYRACFGSGFPGPGLLSLTEAEYLTAASVADAFFPKVSFQVSAAEAGVARYLDRYIHEMPHAKGKLMKLLLRSIEYSPAITLDSLTRFSRLSLEDRQTVLRRWEESRLFAQRMGHRALLFACSSGYFECDAVLAEMGWSTGCIVPPRQSGEQLP